MATGPCLCGDPYCRFCGPLQGYPIGGPDEDDRPDDCDEPDDIDREPYHDDARADE